MNALAPHLPTLTRLARDRARRGQFIEPGLLGEPVWDIMLHLSWAEATGTDAAIKDCALVATGRTGGGTVHRHIGLLADHGLAVRAPDPADRRRVFVRLTDSGRAAMAAYLDTLR